jgi:hypothetical protein
MKRFGTGIDVTSSNDTESQKSNKQIVTVPKVSKAQEVTQKKEMINFVLPAITKKLFKERSKEEYGSFGKSNWINSAIDVLFEHDNWQQLVLDCDPKDCTVREQFSVLPSQKNTIRLRGLELQHYAIEQEHPLQVNGAISMIVRAAIIHRLKH